MKIELWSLGKTNETYVDAGIRDFTKRITNYFKVEWKLIAPLKNSATLSVNETIAKEASLILSLLEKDDYLILLDERGKQLSSEGLAEFIQSRANSSVKKVVFLIGGAFGVDETINKRANFTWCLSSLVFPHQLVRLILSEQLYRACTILKNEKYHHK